jgi:imidazolonepropionase-like amidohydrolase
MTLVPALFLASSVAPLQPRDDARHADTTDGTPVRLPASTSFTRPAAEPTPPGDEVVALVNGTLLDGTGAAPIRNAVLLIRQGRIVAVGERAQVNVPSDAKIINVQGATLLPGLINAHVHRGYDEQKLQAWAQAGVTTVRDLGAAPADDLFARRMRTPNLTRV